MHDNGVVKVLMGFNPVDCARANLLENWTRSFRDVAVELDNLSRHSNSVDAASARRHFILNPIVGPEVITGSTRMKGNRLLIRR
jgi:hypothetical protein